MRLVSESNYKKGMILAKTVFKSDGSIVLKKGIQLKDSYIKRLKKLGVSHIYIKDTLCDDIVIDDVVKENTRRDAIKLVNNVMSKVAISGSIESQKIRKIVNELTNELLNSTNVMIQLIEIRTVDDYTFGHNVNVCVLSLIVGLSLGYDKENLIELGLGAILHDVGKARVPLNILNKKGKLDDYEFEIIKKHTLEGYEVLKSNMKCNNKACEIALYHHERYDGTGYPKGLKADEIPEYVKIVSVADVYDALTSDRVYKKAIYPYQAIEYLVSMSGHQFDKRIVDVFIQNISLFPPGTYVRLNNGQVGCVIKVRKKFPSRPIVKMVYDDKGNSIKNSKLVDLLDYNSLIIEDIVDDI